MDMVRIECVMPAAMVGEFIGMVQSRGGRVMVGFGEVAAEPAKAPDLLAPKVKVKVKEWSAAKARAKVRKQAGGLTCKEMALSLLAPCPLTQKELLAQIVAAGFDVNGIYSRIKELVREGKVHRRKDADGSIELSLAVPQ